MPLRQPVVNNLTKPVLHNDMERFSDAKIYIFSEKCKFFANYFHKKKRNNVGIIVVPRDSVTWLVNRSKRCVTLSTLPH